MTTARVCTPADRLITFRVVTVTRESRITSSGLVDVAECPANPRTRRTRIGKGWRDQTAGAASPGQRPGGGHLCRNECNRRSRAGSHPPRPPNIDQLGRAVLTHGMSFDNPSSHTEGKRSCVFSRVVTRVLESAAIRTIPVHKRDEIKKGRASGEGARLKGNGSR
jgi:hypothetical protein